MRVNRYKTLCLLEAGLQLNTGALYQLALSQPLVHENGQISTHRDIAHNQLSTHHHHPTIANHALPVQTFDRRHSVSLCYQRQTGLHTKTRKIDLHVLFDR